MYGFEVTIPVSKGAYLKTQGGDEDLVIRVPKNEEYPHVIAKLHYPGTWADSISLSRIVRGDDGIEYHEFIPFFGQAGTAVIRLDEVSCSGTSHAVIKQFIVVRVE